MKKIGIMTMQRINNYGSYMQALGLKNIISSLGYNVIFVDYEPGEVITQKKEMNKKNGILHNLKQESGTNIRLREKEIKQELEAISYALQRYY